MICLVFKKLQTEIHVDYHVISGKIHVYKSKVWFMLVLCVKYLRIWASSHDKRAKSKSFFLGAPKSCPKPQRSPTSTHPKWMLALENFRACQAYDSHLRNRILHADFEWKAPIHELKQRSKHRIFFSERINFSQVGCRLLFGNAPSAR